MDKAKIGIIGLGVMGANLARNFASKGHGTVVYNRTAEVMEKFIEEFGGENLAGEVELKDFVESLEKPRRVMMLVKAGSGALTLGIPSSPGVPASVAEDTITLIYNDCESVKQAFAEAGGDIACIIVEPVAGNMNCIPPIPGFLETLRKVCDEYESILIFDEVMTGFRVELNSAQGLYGVTPDLTTLGKVIGGGMPVGAFGGSRKIMDYIAPSGPVYQAGTLSGNPVAMAAGLKTLELISVPGFYQALSEKTRALTSGIQQQAREAGIPLTVNTVGGMFGLFFTEQENVSNFSQVMKCDQSVFKRFFHAMLDEGVYLAPSAFEAGFVSAAHSDEDIENTIEIAGAIFKRL